MVYAGESSLTTVLTVVLVDGWGEQLLHTYNALRRVVFVGCHSLTHFEGVGWGRGTLMGREFVVTIGDMTNTPQTQTDAQTTTEVTTTVTHIETPHNSELPDVRYAGTLVNELEAAESMTVGEAADILGVPHEDAEAAVDALDEAGFVSASSSSPVPEGVEPASPVEAASQEARREYRRIEGQLYALFGEPRSDTPEGIIEALLLDAGNSNDYSGLTYDELAEELPVSRRCIETHVKRLEEAGVVELNHILNLPSKVAFRSDREEDIFPSEVAGVAHGVLADQRDREE